MVWEDNIVTRMIPFIYFPRNCCGHTCDLLSRYFLEHGIRTNMLRGICSKDSQWYHVCLETENGILIDITGDWFVERMVTEKEVKAVHVGGEGTLIKYITEQHRRNRKYIMTRKGERENEKLIYFTGKDKKLQKF